MSTQTLLADRYGRVARDLRVSLTDRCNLRCTYCMPAEGLEWIPTPDTLTDEETIRLIRIAVQQLGIEQVRFTGGEPLLRKSLPDIIAATKALSPAPSTAITTNGVSLHRHAQKLKDAGLDRVNISLDSLDSETYARLTRRDRLDDVLTSIRVASEVGLSPVKVNTVVMPGVNEEDIIPLAEFCLQHDAQLRFIEQMPLGPPNKWDRSKMVTADHILDTLRTRFTLEEAEKPRGSAPAALWHATDGILDGYLGVIAAVTHPFCGDCDRTRLTTDGAIRNCLFAREETSLRDLMRNGATDEELARAWQDCMAVKKAGHGIDSPLFIQPERTMSAIGG